MRLFVGIELPDAARNAASREADRLRTRIEREAPRAVLRWVPSDNLHITLWFIGEVNDARAEDIRDAVSVPFAVPAFTLRVGGGGTFPPSGDPRAVWLGLVHGGDSLIAIYNELAARFAPLGFAPEKRPYSPHLTVARVKQSKRRDAAVVRGALASAPAEIGACRITAVTLLRSRTSPKGSQYEALLRVPLA